MVSGATAKIEIASVAPTAPAIPAGYKQTDVGVIPEDWEFSNISNSTLKARIGWQGLTTREYLSSGEYYLITGTDFVNGRIQWHTCNFVEKIRYDQDKNIQIKNDDILVTKDGTIGKVAYVENFFGRGTLNSGVFVIRPKNSAYLPKFFYYILMSAYFDKFLSQLAAGSTISHLYQKDFVKFNFPLPPTIEEQEAIAGALGDADGLIESLESLIAKKRNIKQGAMQQLLTGTTRLAGFSGKWEVSRIDRFMYVQGGFAFKSEKFQETGLPIIRISNIFDGAINLNDSVYYSEIESIPNDFLVKKGDFLIAMSGANTGKIGEYKSELIAYQNQRVGKFVNKNSERCDSKYFLQLVSSNLFKKGLSKFLEQGAQPNISSWQIEQLEFYTPLDKEEQTAIATILSDMDAEIENLEVKLEKAKQVKQGMMQELLTGKIRLI